MIICRIKKFLKFLKKLLTCGAVFRSIVIFRGPTMTIRETIKKELKRRGWSHYRLVKELDGVIPATSIYEYLRGETDIGSDRASIILQALGLRIICKDKRGKRPGKEVL